jgi:formamidopyrimidine-DNA glycosylase
MPELPEVETVVRTLAPKVCGRVIHQAEFYSALILRHCREPIAQRLEGRTIEGVQRRGKHIVMKLDAGLLVVHLGMTGKLLVDTDRTPHTRAVFELDQGTLLYDDIRMFGSIEYVDALPARMARLGEEPLEISEGEFYRAIHKRRTSIKALLLNQTVVRGLGNIYVDEALFRAGIRPKTNASRLTKARAGRLLDEIRQVLVEAINMRGSSISDYVDAEGNAGGFQSLHRVYGREGKPCVLCDEPIRKIVLAQRGTHFCPRCQR